MKPKLQRESEAVEAAAEGSARRRTLIFSMRQALRAQPAFLVRGSSRRIMTMRIPKPADIRVINRRDDRLDRSLHGFTSPRKKRKPPPRKSCLKCSSISANQLSNEYLQIVIMCLLRFARFGRRSGDTPIAETHKAYAYVIADRLTRFVENHA
jgi:hypothetical protein